MLFLFGISFFICIFFFNLFSKVDSLDSVLAIEVYDSEKIGKENTETQEALEGFYTVSISEFKDQQKFNGWIKLKDSTGEIGESEIRIQVQLSWSKKEYYALATSIMNERISKCKVLLDNFEHLNQQNNFQIIKELDENTITWIELVFEDLKTNRISKVENFKESKIGNKCTFFYA